MQLNLNKKQKKQRKSTLSHIAKSVDIASLLGVGALAGGALFGAGALLKSKGLQNIRHIVVKPVSESTELIKDYKKLFFKVNKDKSSFVKATIAGTAVGAALGGTAGVIKKDHTNLPTKIVGAAGLITASKLLGANKVFISDVLKKQEKLYDYFRDKGTIRSLLFTPERGSTAVHIKKTPEFVKSTVVEKYKNIKMPTFDEKPLTGKKTLNEVYSTIKHKLQAVGGDPELNILKNINGKKYHSSISGVGTDVPLARAAKLNNASRDFSVHGGLELSLKPNKDVDKVLEDLITQKRTITKELKKSNREISKETNINISNKNSDFIHLSRRSAGGHTHLSYADNISQSDAERISNIILAPTNYSNKKSYGRYFLKKTKYGGDLVASSPRIPTWKASSGYKAFEERRSPTYLGDETEWASWRKVLQMTLNDKKLTKKYSKIAKELHVSNDSDLFYHPKIRKEVSKVHRELLNDLNINDKSLESTINHYKNNTHRSNIEIV